MGVGCFCHKSKEFHDLSEDEKQKIIKDMEKEDENLVFNMETIDYDPNYIDQWKQKLPCNKDDKDLEIRIKLFKDFNRSEKRYISYKRLQISIVNYLELPNIIRDSTDANPIRLAANAAMNKYIRCNKIDCVLEWREFRIFLYYLKQYFTYMEIFKVNKKPEEHIINFEEFKKAVPQMNKFGVKLTEIEAQIRFKKLDIDKDGNISFDDFCSYLIQNSIDLEDDKDWVKNETDKFQ